jgi:NADH-quinone oxidoreductase subunit J
MTLDFNLIAFLALALVAVGSAVGMLFSRNAVHSALWLVANFAVVSLFFLILGAPFIAMVQVTVYAGAIMVLFLFVIMLLGAELLRRPGQALPWQAPLTAFLFVVFVGALGIYFTPQLLGGGAPWPAASADFGSPTEIGLTLFNQYVLPFEVTSFLLLVGMIGAVVLTRDDKKK